MPANIVEVANVVSNGLTLKMPMITPFTIPQATATASAVKAAAGTEKPFPARVMITTLTSDTIEPSEISVPAIMMVAETPIATHNAGAFVSRKNLKKDSVNPWFMIALIPVKITRSSNAGK